MMKSMIKKSSVFAVSFLFMMMIVMACFSAKVYAGRLKQSEKEQEVLFPGKTLQWE